MHLPPIVASVIYIVGIAGVFWLDRDPQAQISKALWIPTTWLMIICSRPTSMWLGMSTNKGAETYVEGSPIDAAVFMVLTLAGLAVVIARYHRVEPILRGNLPILLFFMFAAFSILWSDFPLVTLKHWVKGIGDVLMVLIVLTEPAVTDAIKRLVTRLGFLLLPLSLLFCKYYPAIGRGRTLSAANEGWRGVTMGKNILGGVCMLLGIGLLWRLRSVYNDREDPRRRGKLLALGTVLLITVYLLWKCNSMTSICAAAMASAVLLLSSRPLFRRNPVLVHLLIVGMLGASAYALFFQSTLLENLGRDPTVTGRTEIWKAVLSLPVSRLGGAGYESFWLGPRVEQIWARFPDMLISEAHNGYLEMYINLGWIGVLLLAGIMISGYRAAIAALRNDPALGGLYLAWWVQAAVRGQTEAAFRMLSNSWIFFLLAVMAASQVRVPSDVHDEEPDPSAVENQEPSEFALGTSL